MYLACSWTWCIGMFLPVLLVRDYGICGFVVFAVPNVVGAGAMGWVLRAPGAAAALVQKHEAACRAFSVATIGFHVYFLSSTLLHSAQPGSLPWWCWILFGGSVVAAFAPAGLGASWAVAVILWMLSASVGVIGLATGAFQSAWAAFIPLGGSEQDLAWLAPVCAFGFALCPYLDFTFAAARSQAPGRTGTAAFALGFGVLFLAMILLTLGYAPLWLGPSAGAGAAVRAAVVWHILAQSVFTVVLHAGALVVRDGWLEKRERPSGYRTWERVTCLAILGSFILGIITPILPGHAGLGAAEIGYRCFMSFYGLVFPAYVWLLMIPTRDGHSGLGGESGRRKLLIWAGAVGVAAPMFWMGFIERQEFWLVPGLGVVLLARLVLPRGHLGAHRSKTP
jgi:hypothetical protein